MENFPISIAPMMGYTDSPFRIFMRAFTKKVVLYTEMMHIRAILETQKKARNMLAFETSLENPLILQLGGNNMDDLIKCAELAREESYAGINLNVGCPSPKVQRGDFGVVLMDKPKFIGQALKEMHRASGLPVSVKHRIGFCQSTDEMESFQKEEEKSFAKLRKFVEEVYFYSDETCNSFIIHARLAILNGFSPKDNRKVPPLNYEFVYKIKELFPSLRIELNGGISTITELHHHLKSKGGIMIGRAAYKKPLLFYGIDEKNFYKPYEGEESEHAPSKLPHEDFFLKKFPAAIWMLFQKDMRSINSFSSTKQFPNNTKRYLNTMLNMFNSYPGNKKWKMQIASFNTELVCALENYLKSNKLQIDYDFIFERFRSCIQSSVMR